MQKIKLLAASILMCLNGFSQTDPAVKPKTVQYEIMSMPFTKENEDVRTVLENNPKLRIGISKTNEAFSKRGFKTKDFTATLKEAKEANIFNADNQTDVKSQLALFSGADIYVEVDLIPYTEKGETNVTIILRGYEASTGQILSEKQGNSGNWKTRDTGQLASVAVEKIADEFLEMMNGQFATIREDGKTVKVYINFAQGSKYNTESELPGTSLPFADLMEDWMGKNAFKSYYKLQSAMKLSLIFSDVHIPFKDPKTNRSYTPSNFALLIYSYLRSLNLSVSKDTKISSIYITIK